MIAGIISCITCLLVIAFSLKKIQNKKKVDCAGSETESTVLLQKEQQDKKLLFDKILLGIFLIQQIFEISEIL